MGQPDSLPRARWQWPGMEGVALSAPRPDQPPSRPPMGKISQYPLYDRWSEHPGRRLTPTKLIAAYDLAEMGEPQEQCDIFDDRIEADAHLRSTLETRVDSVARKPWVIQEGGDSDADRQAARELEMRLRLVPNLIETFEHQLRFNWYGYSWSEIDWRPVDGMIAPTWFENAAARRFRFDREDYPLLITERNLLGEFLRPGRWWGTCRTGRTTAMTGLMRTACWWSMFKAYAVRDWMVWANRYGIPMVYGVYEDDAQVEDVAALKKALQAIGKDGWAAFNKACEIHIQEVKAGGRSEDVHGALTALCDAQISKLVNGATQNIEVGSAGSYAQAKVHADRAHDILSGDAERLAHSFEVAIGLPFVRYNNLAARPPRLKIHIVRDMSPEMRLKIFDGARNLLAMPLDEDQVRQELQLKAPTGATIDPPADPAPAAPAGPGGPPDEE